VANVYDGTSQRVGRVEPDGAVYHADGPLVGRVIAATGQIVDPAFGPLGWVSPQGVVSDLQGDTLGEVRSDGGVYDWRGRYLGYVAAGVGPTHMGGAALLLLGLASA
jgi:hypothetical protein